MSFSHASYSDEVAAPVKGYRAGSGDACAWGPHNIIAVATKCAVQFSLFSYATQLPSAPMHCDGMEEVKLTNEMHIDRVTFAPYLLSDAAVRRITGGGGLQSGSDQGEGQGGLGTALCAWKTITSVVEVMPISRVRPSADRMTPVAIGRQKMTILPQYRPPAPTASSAQKNALAHIPAFSYHLVDLQWVSAGELILVTNLGLMYVDAAQGLADAAKKLSGGGGGDGNDAKSSSKKKKGPSSSAGASTLKDGIVPSVLSGLPSNATPTVLVEAKERIAAWPQGFGPICSAIVENPSASSVQRNGNAATSATATSSSSHLLIVAGLQTIAGRQQSILIGYDITTVYSDYSGGDSSPPPPPRPSCLCRTAFAVNVSSRVLSIVPHFAKVAASAALAACDSFTPSAMAARIVASSRAGVHVTPFNNITPVLAPPPTMVSVGGGGGDKEMRVVEVVMGGPSGTLMAHLSLNVAANAVPLPSAGGSPIAATNTAITGVALVARWGVGFGPVTVPVVPTTATTVPAAQCLVHCDTITAHTQDACINRIIPLHRDCPLLSAIKAVTTKVVVPPPPAATASNNKGVGAPSSGKPMTIAEKLKASAAAAAAPPPTAPSAPAPTPSAPTTALVTIATAAAINAHYILLGPEAVTLIGIARSGANTANATLASYSSTPIDVFGTAIANHAKGVTDALPPLVFSGGLAMHPSGAVGVALCGISRQRRDEIRLVPFATTFANIYALAVKHFALQRSALSAAVLSQQQQSASSSASSVVAPPRHALAPDAANKDPAVTLAAVYEPHHDSRPLTSALGKVGDACTSLEELCTTILSSPKGSNNPATNLLSLVSSSGGGAVALGPTGVPQQHKGVMQLGHDLSMPMMRAVLCSLLSTVMGDVSVAAAASVGGGDGGGGAIAMRSASPLNKADLTRCYAAAAWDAVLLDSTSFVPTNDAAPAPLVAVETLSAKLLISLTELFFEQIEVGQLSVPNTSDSGTASAAVAAVWLGGRRQYGADLYSRHPMATTASSSSPPPPYWQRSLIAVGQFIRAVEMHKTFSNTAVEWIQTQRRRLTAEVLAARAIATLQGYLRGASSSSSSSLSSLAAVAVADAVLRGFAQMLALDLSGAFTESIAHIAKLLEAVRGHHTTNNNGDAIAAMAVEVLEPSFLASANTVGVGGKKLEGGRKRAREDGTTASSSSFITPPLSVLITLPSSGGAAMTTVAPVDALTMMPMEWGSNAAGLSVGRCTAGCGQQTVLAMGEGDNSNQTKTMACPFCRGQLSFE